MCAWQGYVLHVYKRQTTEANAQQQPKSRRGRHRRHQYRRPVWQPQGMNDRRGSALLARAHHRNRHVAPQPRRTPPPLSLSPSLSLLLGVINASARGTNHMHRSYFRNELKRDECERERGGCAAEAGMNQDVIGTTKRTNERTLLPFIFEQNMDDHRATATDRHRRHQAAGRRSLVRSLARSSRRG